MTIDDPIAIFDSGVGSLSIIKEIRNALPSENYIYLADKKHFPYGKKTHDELLRIIQNTVEYLSENFTPKLIVLASNTPSIQVLHELKKGAVDVIGVFPPVNEAVSVSKTGHIAILATQNTVMSSELDEYIHSLKMPASVKIIKWNASRMVELVETGDFLSNKEKSLKIISEELSLLDETDNMVDAITLSSTHLPFLNEYFTLLRPCLHLIDPAKIVAGKVKRLLEGNLRTTAQKGALEILATQGKESLETIIKRLGIQEEIHEVRF